jgi:signal peptidase I
MLIRWFFSRTVRDAVEMRKHVLKLLCAQRDILSPEACESITQACEALRQTLLSGGDKAAIRAGMEALEAVAVNKIKTYPNAVWRENVEVFLVAIAVAMGIRTFFLQPMKIPTGSMQPTLYGITYEDMNKNKDSKAPTGLSRWVDLIFYGTTYYNHVATEGGVFQIIDDKPRRVFPLVYRQQYKVGNESFTIWFPGENFFEHIYGKTGFLPGHVFKKGEDILNVKVVAGDHLFVNRLTYNFTFPKRGDIVIFETRGIDALPPDTYYIKRLVGLGNDRIRIGDDHHLVINGTRLDASMHPFENVYTFDPEYKPDHYFGHVNQTIASRITRGSLAPLFPEQTSEFIVPNNHYMVMGDNTMNSSDSRTWGSFPREKVIGKSSFVYWPLSSRFGWSHF